jgi:hypothetical protein
MLYVTHGVCPVLTPHVRYVEPRRGFCRPHFQGARMALVMRWTKRFLKRLALSEPQAPNPEERPAEHPAPVSHAGVAGALCARCRHALVRNPHEVRARPRTRAQRAPRRVRALPYHALSRRAMKRLLYESGQEWRTDLRAHIPGG